MFTHNTNNESAEMLMKSINNLQGKYQLFEVEKKNKHNK